MFLAGMVAVFVALFTLWTLWQWKVDGLRCAPARTLIWRAHPRSTPG
jgi:hypothetical protein